MKRFFLIISIFIFGTVLYGYTQFLKKETVSAVLQQQINLENPQDVVFAISTYDQKLSNGKNIPRGTRFIGKLSKEGDILQINFNSIQLPDREKEDFPAKSNLNVQSQTQTSGVSANISKTLYKQTKTNVLGAIFKGSNLTEQSNGSILPKGSIIKIQVD